MAYSPDPQTIDTSMSRADAIAGFFPTEREFIIVDGLHFRRHPAPATWDALLLTNDGTVGWDHDGEWMYPEHAGLVGREIEADEDDNHPSLVGVPDEGDEIQALLDYVIAKGASLKNGPRKIYGTSIPLFCGRDTTGATPGVNFVKLHGLKIGVVGGTWSASDWVLVLGNSVIATNGSTFRYWNVQDVWVDGGDLAHNGVFYSRVAHSFVKNTKVIHCSAILQQIGNNAELGSGGVNDCGGTTFEDIWGRQWVFGDDNYDNWEETTATGLVWRSDDNKIRNPDFGQFRVGLEVFGFSQGDMWGGHFWNGAGGETEADSVSLYMHGCAEVRLHKVRFDQGAWLIEDAFRNVALRGCTINQYSLDPVRLVTTQTDEDLRTFRISECTTRTAAASMHTVIEITASTAFAAGETITGGTSGATADIVMIVGDKHYLSGLTGTFQVAEAVTGDVAGAGTVDTVNGSWTSPVNPVLFGNIGNDGGPFSIGNRVSGNRIGQWRVNTDGAVATVPISGPGGRVVEAGITATTAQLNNVAHAINTTDKYEGKVVRNTNTKIKVYAEGPDAADEWINGADGSTAHTPV